MHVFLAYNTRYFHRLVPCRFCVLVEIGVGGRVGVGEGETAGVGVGVILSHCSSFAISLTILLSSENSLLKLTLRPVVSIYEPPIF